MTYCGSCPTTGKAKSEHVVFGQCEIPLAKSANKRYFFQELHIYHNKRAKVEWLNFQTKFSYKQEKVVLHRFDYNKVILKILVKEQSFLGFLSC